MAEQHVQKIDIKFEKCRLGRFMFDPPVEMKQSSTKFVVHYTEFQEFLWKEPENHKNEITKLWETRLSAIKTAQPPRGIDNIVIETMDFSANDRWAKGVFYYGNSNTKRAGYWDVLIDGKTTGVWLTLRGTVNRRDNMVELLKNLVHTYEAPKVPGTSVPITGSGKFHLKYGVVDLPFDYSEEVYARFEGHPLDKHMKLSVKMEVVEKVEETGLIERLSAAMMSNFAPGLSIEKIRTKKRALAGLEGEEVVFKGTEDGDSNLSFSWRYPGKPDSAQEPEILITLESKDGDLDEKLKLWDSVLDSLRPL